MLRIIFLLSVFFLAGCSGTYRIYYNDLKTAFTPAKDIILSQEQISNNSSDLLYVKLGEQHQVVMALAVIEAGQQKWVSADNAIITLDEGRVFSTAGFNQDLLYTGNRELDPLKQGLSLKLPSTWQRTTDWHDTQYGYTVNSDFTESTSDSLEFFRQRINTIRITENVTFGENKQSWQNHYWYDADTGRLLKTYQQISPLWQPLELTFISRINRAVQQKQQSFVTTPSATAMVKE